MIATRAEARTLVLQTANRHRVDYGSRHGKPLPLLAMRHLQRAVFSCRQRALVAPAVLGLAGFRP